jgi:hypothetical protein
MASMREDDSMPPTLLQLPLTTPEGLSQEFTNVVVGRLWIHGHNVSAIPKCTSQEIEVSTNDLLLGCCTLSILVKAPKRASENKWFNPAMHPNNVTYSSVPKVMVPLGIRTEKALDTYDRRHLDQFAGCKQAIKSLRAMDMDQIGLPIAHDCSTTP